jgi:hypothetical protein
VCAYGNGIYVDMALWDARIVYDGAVIVMAVMIVDG